MINYKKKALNNKSCVSLSKEIAYSTGKIEDFIRYFAIKELAFNIENIDKLDELKGSNSETYDDGGRTI